MCECCCETKEDIYLPLSATVNDISLINDLAFDPFGTFSISLISSLPLIKYENPMNIMFIQVELILIIMALF